MCALSTEIGNESEYFKCLDIGYLYYVTETAWIKMGSEEALVEALTEENTVN